MEKTNNLEEYLSQRIKSMECKFQEEIDLEKRKYKSLSDELSLQKLGIKLYQEAKEFNLGALNCQDVSRKGLFLTHNDPFLIYLDLEYVQNPFDLESCKESSRTRSLEGDFHRENKIGNIPGMLANFSGICIDYEKILPEFDDVVIYVSGFKLKLLKHEMDLKELRKFSKNDLIIAPCSCCSDYKELLKDTIDVRKSLSEEGIRAIKPVDGRKGFFKLFADYVLNDKLF